MWNPYNKMPAHWFWEPSLQPMLPKHWAITTSAVAPTARSWLRLPGHCCGTGWTFGDQT